MKLSDIRPHPLPPHAKAPIRRVEHLVTHLERLDLFYAWGGARVFGAGAHVHGPGRRGEAWTDCSGFGIYCLRVLGIELANPVGNTTSLLSEPDLEKGRGKYLTLLIKEIPGHPDESHMLVELRGRHAECGGFDNPSSRGGPSWFKPGEARLAEFPHHLHVPGL